MKGYAVHRCLVVVVAVAALLALPDTGMAAPRVLGAYFRADEVVTEFGPYWGDAPTEEAQANVGGSVHVFLASPDPSPAAVEDVRFEGISLTEAVAHTEKRRKQILHPASIFFSKLGAAEKDRLMAAGEPVWWRVEPNPVPAGGAAEVTIRLRSKPQGESLKVTVVIQGGPAEVSVPVRLGEPRFKGIGFAKDLTTAFLYVSPGTGGRKPARIRMDGKDLAAGISIGTDPRTPLVPVVVTLPKPLEPMSFHVFEAVYDDGRKAYAAVRAWSDEFGYGMWGSRPGKEADVELARRYVQDLYQHCVNVQMEMVGSAAVREFLKSDAGRSLCASLGIRRMVESVGKGRTRNPFAYFLVDEPDCGDYRVEDLPHAKRVGSLAQPLVLRSAELRRQDPATPHLLNVDMTYKPNNWLIYGQVPDIFAADPYYQERLREAIWSHPERLPLYRKATFISAVGVTCQSACEPRPLHLILNSVRHTKPERRFRYATPPEKRIEVFYALAAGAKGLSYWWFTPGGTYSGVGADDPQARALWKEIGLLGAEVRTAGPVIVRSCPVEIPVTAPLKMWVRCLAAGLDTLVILCVNDDYENTESGTTIRPVEAGKVSLRIPDWLDAKNVFEVAAVGVKEAAWKTAAGQLEIDLGRLDVTRLLLVTSDPGLRSMLSSRYEQEFAARVTELLKN